MPALPGAAHDLPSAVLYRAPNIGAVADMVLNTRGMNMGQLIKTGLDAPVRVADALARGKHVGMLVDQYYVRGVPVTFFGRQTMANPLIARLARQVDCPIHGTRVIRLPGHRFRAELTEEVAPVRDADGQRRYRRHDAGDHQCGRRLGPRISGAMAVAAPPVAVGAQSGEVDTGSPSECATNKEYTRLSSRS